MKTDIICSTCGTQYNSTNTAGAICPICNDDRQYVPETGQSWTNLNELQERYRSSIKQIYENLFEIQSSPVFAIGQRALLLVTPQGNILWDCIALINDDIIEFIKQKGGLKAIAISHPHYYTTMNEWAEVFNCPIYIHQKDEEWIYNRGKHVKIWNGAELPLWLGMKLINIGGHFPGSSVLHIPFLADTGGILCGDTFYVSPSKKHAAVMYSYPNRIPLPIEETERIKKYITHIKFDALYGFYDYQNIHIGAKELIVNSLNRYT